MTYYLLENESRNHFQSIFNRWIKILSTKFWNLIWSRICILSVTRSIVCLTSCKNRESFFIMKSYECVFSRIKNIFRKNRFKSFFRATRVSRVSNPFSWANPISHFLQKNLPHLIHKFMRMSNIDVHILSKLQRFELSPLRSWHSG